MFNDTIISQLKAVADEHNTTQASVIEQLVSYGLDNVDLETLDFEPRKKRGRKKGSKNVAKVAAVEETVEEEVPTVESLPSEDDFMFSDEDVAAAEATA